MNWTRLKLGTLALITFLVVLFQAALVFAQDCPEGYKCLTDEQAEEVLAAVELQNCMVEAAANDDIDLEWKPNHITITEDGQVFTQDKSVANLRWCDWSLELTGDNKVIVNRKEPDADWGFRLRVKLGVAWLPTYIGQGSFTDMIDPVLLLEPFHLWEWHIQVHGGLKAFGLSVGMDITENADVFVGVGLGYKDADIVPAIGVSLSFN